MTLSAHRKAFDLSLERDRAGECWLCGNVDTVSVVAADPEFGSEEEVIALCNECLARMARIVGGP